MGYGLILLIGERFTYLFFHPLVLLNRFGRDSRGRFGTVAYLGAGSGSTNGTPGFAACEDRGAKHQGENQ